MSRQKQKGTAAESVVLRHVQAQGFPWAYRLALEGTEDCGDIALLPGRAAILEVKNHASAATGQPGDALLGKWLYETAREASNADADHAALVVKKKGTTNAGKWWCYLTLDDLASLTGGVAVDPAAVACITVDTYLTLLRASGYGTELEDIA